MNSSHAHPQASHPNQLGKSQASTTIPDIDPSTTKYQALFKRAIRDAMKAHRIREDICAGFTAMGPNQIDRYLQYRIFRDAKEAMDKKISDDKVIGNTVVYIANYLDRLGTVPPHWDVTYVIPSDSSSDESDSSSDESAEDSDDDDPRAFRPVPAADINRKLDYGGLFDTSEDDDDEDSDEDDDDSDEDDDDSDEDDGDYDKDDREELPHGMHRDPEFPDDIVYMSPDMCPDMGNPLDGGYEPPPFDEVEEAAPASRTRKRALVPTRVPTRYSQRVATRARKKRRFFPQ